MSSPDPTAQPKKFYLTTPIYYVNARPHIGHAYTTIVADVLARRHRLLGEDTFFLTGTDEHGQKIERSAQAKGMPPQQFADEVAASFEGLWKRMGITNNRFIRTTDPCHKRGVQQLFNTLYERGFIYLDSYTGAYCVSDEAFVDVPVGAPCPDCGRVTEQVTEENFFFKLSAFQRPLLDLIESGTLKVEPEARRNEVLSFLRGNTTERSRWPELWETSLDGSWHSDNELLNKHLDFRLGTGDLKKSEAGHVYTPGALKDLSISRSSFTWGVPVPEVALRHADAKDKHVIYVWLDALANYMTAVGYGDPSPKAQAEFSKWWPADLHLVGKEIIRFHCVYWPAFLLAADLPLPKAITAHGWLLFDNSKMSKSKGNIVRTETILDAFGEHVYAKQFPESTKQERDLFAADVLRYFLLREIPFGQDGSFSFEAMVTRYNADLANGYGNLVSRVLNLIAKTGHGAIEDCLEANSLVFYLFPRVETPSRPEQAEVLGASEGQALGWSLIRIAEAFADRMNQNAFAEGLTAVMRAITAVDGFISTRKPWAVTETNLSLEGRRSTLYSAAESIRIITALLYPILPFATARVWAQLGLGDIEAAAANGELNNLQWGGLKPGTKLGPLAPIFPRADKSLIQIMTDMENTRDSAPQGSPDLTAVNAQHDASNPDTSPFPEAPIASAGTSSATTPGAPSSRSASSSAKVGSTNFKDAATPTPAATVPTSTTDPAAPPRSLDEPAGTLPVAGSLAEKPTLPTTPGPASEAPASGAFGGTASQTSISAQPSDASPQITIDDFAKVELRVAQIVVAERIPKADKLLRLEVDLGYERRQILSGIAEWYQPEELVGRRIVVITNLAPRKMRGLESHGMLLAASHGDSGKPVLATFGEDIALGSRLK